MQHRVHRCGWVAVLGPPNAGKSTLLNAALGQKVAIVTPRAQTTRNRITGILSEQNSQVLFMDTPGIHQLRGKMNRVLLQTARQAADSADLLLVVLDAALYAGTPDRLEKDLKPLEAAIAAETRPVLTALNKVDLLGDKSRLLPLLQCLAELWPRAELFPLSSLTRVGMPELLAHIKALLPEAPAQFPPDQLSTLSVRFMAAEIIREKLFLSLRRELPYSTAVDIEDWHEEHDKNLTVINALIYVGRATHKAMVIGKGGRNLKSVGQAARKEITELLGNRVHLELWVKTQENWPEDSGFLHALGLGR